MQTNAFDVYLDVAVQWPQHNAETDDWEWRWRRRQNKWSEYPNTNRFGYQLVVRIILITYKSHSSHVHMLCYAMLCVRDCHGETERGRVCGRVDNETHWWRCRLLNFSCQNENNESSIVTFCIYTAHSIQYAHTRAECYHVRCDTEHRQITSLSSRRAFPIQLGNGKRIPICI